MDDKIESLIGTMKVMTRDNLGVVINPVAFDDGVLTIEYFEGENEECPECLMSPNSLGFWMRVGASHSRVGLAEARATASRYRRMS